MKRDSLLVKTFSFVAQHEPHDGESFMACWDVLAAIVALFCAMCKPVAVHALAVVGIVAQNCFPNF